MHLIIKEDKKLATNNERLNGLTIKFKQLLTYIHVASGMNSVI